MSDIQKTNPIDINFDKDFNQSSMNEFNIISAVYASSWNDELAYTAEII